MTVHAPGRGGTAQQPAPGDGADRPGRLLPGWAKVLVVVAHPDDESFGLGAIISQMTATGAAAHILCYTHGEASTLNENEQTWTPNAKWSCDTPAPSWQRPASLCSATPTAGSPPSSRQHWLFMP